MSIISAGLFLGFTVAASVSAFEGRIVLPDGTPGANCHVAVVGRPGSTGTNAEGRFRVAPAPPIPATLIVVGPRGEIYAPLTIDAAPDAALQLRLADVMHESITVVPGVAPHIESSPAAATAVVTGEDMRERQAERVVDALKGVPGVSGADGGATAVPAIRGLSRGRTLIVLDGTRVATERRAGASAAFVDPFSLAALEVARGPGSVAYGSDALGGVILLRSRDPVPGETTMRYQVGTTLGGANSTQAGVELSGTLGTRTAALLSVHGRRADDARAGGGEAIDSSSSRDGGGALRIVTDTSAGRFRVSYSFSEGRDIGKPERDSSVVRTTYPIESSHRGTFDWQTRAGGWSDVEVSGFVGQYRLVLDREQLAARQVRRSDVDAHDASLRIGGVRQIEHGTVRAGVELAGRFGLSATTIDSAYDTRGELVSRSVALSVEDAERWGTGVFVVYDRPLGSRAILSIGSRGDSIRTHNRGGYFGDHSTSKSAFSGHAGVTAAVAPNLSASLQLARGFRDATLSDRYFHGVSGRGFVSGNPELDPESSLQIDGALRWQRSRSSIALFAYSYRINDLIERYRAGTDFFFRNRGAAVVRGLELEAGWRLSSALHAQLALGAQSGRNSDGGNLNDIPSPGGHLTVRWSGAGKYALARVGAFRSDTRPGPTELPLAGHTTFDAGFGWQKWTRGELRIYASNLLDRRYFASADEIAPLAEGRAVSITFSGKW